MFKLQRQSLTWLDANVSGCLSDNADVQPNCRSDSWLFIWAYLCLFGHHIDCPFTWICFCPPVWLQPCLTRWLTGTACNQTLPADWLTGQTGNQYNEWLTDWTNARICPRYELKCTYRKQKNLFLPTLRFTYKRPINLSAKSNSRR